MIVEPNPLHKKKARLSKRHVSNPIDLSMILCLLPWLRLFLILERL